LQRMIVGGPLMGFAVHAEHLPVIKTTNCVLVDCGGENGLSQRGTVMPCIRCGACTDVCPIRLLPQQMYWHTKGGEFDRLAEYDLFDCIECGCCDYVCPAQIPLVQYYRYAKAEVWQRERERQKSDMARERHEFRQLRIEREKAERAEKHKKRMHALKDEPKVSSDETPREDPKKAAILAAMERAKAKKDLHKAAPKNTDNLTEAQRKKIAEIDARRAQASGEDSAASGQKNVDDEQ
ncbi:MAG: 4Fe-4S dicluster domain-containing protein, partial [Gammaproteobacteria bacterium]|nr:4Fe-4S dicluster domain-containing protein [Gammaproteobacteria bacterium]